MSADWSLKREKEQFTVKDDFSDRLVNWDSVPKGGDGISKPQAYSLFLPVTL